MYKGGLYLSVGDSTTWSQTTPGSSLYTSQIWRGINKNYGFIRHLKKGFGGATSTDVVNNLSWVLSVYPDLVTIGLGMNDASLVGGNPQVDVTTYQNNIGTIIDTILSRNSKAHIICCTPNQTNDPNRPNIQAYRDAMATIAQSKNVPCIRFETAWTSGQIATYNNADGVHPNASGHQLLYNLMWSTVQQGLWLKTLSKR